jgi:Pvc16 N-terminal domain
MSSHLVLAAVSSGIRRILWNSFAGDPTVRPLVGTEEAIVFLNPTDTAKDSGNRVSLWMYLIAENEFIKNAPPLRIADHQEQFPPLGLDLYYLLTPFGPSAEADLLILGRAMQALYDNGRTTLINPAAQVAEDLSINLFRRTLDELSRVWEALQEPYRLSVCYQVRITRVDSTLTTPVSPVLEMNDDFQQGAQLAGVP